MGLTEISNRIRSAEASAGRADGSVTLVAVSKKQPDERVAQVLEDGHRVFGENRVQEAQAKWPRFHDRFGRSALHLIGPLQSNKARDAMELFDVIQVLDRPKLARTIARLAQDLGQCPSLFIQVNTGAEDQKAGIAPGETDSFVRECRSLDLPVDGLMCIPPVYEEQSLHFALLAKLAERNGLPNLSMGMSADFEAAIALGATHVRIGSALFGDRPTG